MLVAENKSRNSDRFNASQQLYFKEEELKEYKNE
jgi:hypothetical protein